MEGSKSQLHEPWNLEENIEICQLEEIILPRELYIITSVKQH
jgi:hypothetical protein